MISFGLPRRRIDLGLEKQSQSFLEVDRPFRLLPGDLGNADLTADKLENDGLFEQAPDLRVDLGHLGQVKLAPILTITAVHRVHAGIQTLVDLGELGLFQRQLKLVLGQNIDKDSSVNSKARVVGSQFGHAGQQATAVLENVLLALLPSPFTGVTSEGAA